MGISNRVLATTVTMQRNDNSSKPTAGWQPVSYSDLTGWRDDDHTCAARCLKTALGTRTTSPRPMGIWVQIQQALQSLFNEHADNPPNGAARNTLEALFAPHRYCGDSGDHGQITGYFEPSFQGSRQATHRHTAPVHARPHDLETLIPEADRGARPNELTHARRTTAGPVVPFATRREIDQGALAGQGLELCYLDPVDLFIMQVQGSGIVNLDDVTSVRLIYDGKNGHPYTSIGRHLISTGEIPAKDMTLKALEDWLRADPSRARETLWCNESYVFFRILGAQADTSALGTDAIPLIPMRSLAVDTAFHELATPVFISSPQARHLSGNAQGFHRLMIASDVGSAITGPQRGDVFCGSGPDAGSKAGTTNHAASFFPLLPREM